MDIGTPPYGHPVGENIEAAAVAAVPGEARFNPTETFAAPVHCTGGVLLLRVHEFPFLLRVAGDGLYHADRCAEKVAWVVEAAGRWGHRKRRDRSWLRSRPTAGASRPCPKARRAQAGAFRWAGGCSRIAAALVGALQVPGFVLSVIFPGGWGAASRSSFCRFSPIADCFLQDRRGVPCLPHARRIGPSRGGVFSVILPAALKPASRP
jgi:hypothetical protein